jgi:hypothetical protein
MGNRDSVYESFCIFFLWRLDPFPDFSGSGNVDSSYVRVIYAN